MVLKMWFLKGVTHESNMNDDIIESEDLTGIL